jgi:hypothetical protein
MVTLSDDRKLVLSPEYFLGNNDVGRLQVKWWDLVDRQEKK